MEKERYYKKKIIKDCLFPEGLFEIKNRNCKKWSLIIEDKKNADKIVEVLNQQDARIKELENLLNASAKIKTNTFNSIQRLKQENQQLKQSQNQKAIEVLEKIKEKAKVLFVHATYKHNDYYTDEYNMIADFDFDRIIDNQIKELRGDYNE